MNIIDIEDTLRAWALTAVPVGTPVIFLYPGADRPLVPYVGLNLFLSRDRGFEETLNTVGANDTVDVLRSTPKEISVSVNVYYDGALQTTDTLVESLKNIKNTELLRQGGLGFIRASGTRKIPEVINKRWEERAQFDAFFFTRSQYTENIEAIEVLEISGLGVSQTITK